MFFDVAALAATFFYLEDKKMMGKTFVIIDTNGCYYRSFCDNFFTTAHCQVFVTDTSDYERAKKFRFLWWATHRAKILSIKASCYHYVYEVIREKPEQILIIRNNAVIERIRKKDSETLEEVERIIAEWKIKHGRS